METLNIEYSTLISTKGNSHIYYVEDESHYDLIIVKPDFVNIATIYKNVDTNEINDFENNYKSTAILVSSIDDAIALGYAELNN